jgi:hypothetical protein
MAVPYAVIYGLTKEGDILGATRKLFRSPVMATTVSYLCTGSVLRA